MRKVRGINRYLGFIHLPLTIPAEEEIKNQVVTVALRHHLVSHYTSLVAVEQTQSKPQGEESGKEKLPLPLPQGWEMGQSPVNIPAAGTEMWLFILLGVLLISLSAISLVIRKKVW